MCRCGTSGYGLAGMVVLGWQLDLMILEVFSNLNNSVILNILTTGIPVLLFHGLKPVFIILEDTEII